MEEGGTTTIQVTHEIWAALDRRKKRGESFDDVIRRLINATPVKVGDLEASVQDAIPEFETREVEDYDGDETCVNGDPIEGDVCGNPAVAKQDWRYPDDDEWSTWYYCEDCDPRQPHDEDSSQPA